jgi:integrase
MYSDPRRPQHDAKPRQRKSGYWSILFYQKFRSPKQNWVPTGIQSRYLDNWKAHVPAEVNRLLVEWTRLWREGKYDPWDDEPPGQVTTKEAIDRFLADHEGAESTKKSYRTTLEPFVAMLSEGLPVASVQSKHVKRYVTQEHLSRLTPRAYFNRLRMFFGYCLEKHWIFEDPIAKVTAPDEPRGSSRSIFLPREFERIMMVAKSDAILNRDREVCSDAYELAMATGMRVGELRSRAWGDIDFERGLIRVDDQPAAGGFTVKNDPSHRGIPMWPRALEILKRSRHPHVAAGAGDSKAAAVRTLSRRTRSNRYF